jgi:hypothetical protein
MRVLVKVADCMIASITALLYVGLEVERYASACTLLKSVAIVLYALHRSVCDTFSSKLSRTQHIEFFRIYETRKLLSPYCSQCTLSIARSSLSPSNQSDYLVSHKVNHVLFDWLIHLDGHK